nr:uncharacterized protein PB18E9.04c-like [Aegilops tauschii subsp. strangulata]
MQLSSLDSGELLGLGESLDSKESPLLLEELPAKPGASSTPMAVPHGLPLSEQHSKRRPSSSKTLNNSMEAPSYSKWMARAPSAQQACATSPHPRVMKMSPRGDDLDLRPSTATGVDSSPRPGHELRVPRLRRAGVLLRLGEQRNGLVVSVNARGHWNLVAMIPCSAATKPLTEPSCAPRSLPADELELEAAPPLPLGTAPSLATNPPPSAGAPSRLTASVVAPSLLAQCQRPFVPWPHSPSRARATTPVARLRIALLEPTAAAIRSRPATLASGRDIAPLPAAPACCSASLLLLRLLRILLLPARGSLLPSLVTARLAASPRTPTSACPPPLGRSRAAPARLPLLATTALLLYPSLLYSVLLATVATS